MSSTGPFTFRLSWQIVFPHQHHGFRRFNPSISLYNSKYHGNQCSPSIVPGSYTCTCPTSTTPFRQADRIPPSQQRNNFPPPGRIPLRFRPLLPVRSRRRHSPSAVLLLRPQVRPRPHRRQRIQGLPRSSKPAYLLLPGPTGKSHRPLIQTRPDQTTVSPDTIHRCRRDCHVRFDGPTRPASANHHIIFAITTTEPHKRPARSSSGRRSTAAIPNLLRTHRRANHAEQADPGRGTHPRHRARAGFLQAGPDRPAAETVGENTCIRTCTRTRTVERDDDVSRHRRPANTHVPRGGRAPTTAPTRRRSGLGSFVQGLRRALSALPCSDFVYIPCFFGRGPSASRAWCPNLLSRPGRQFGL